MMRPTEQNTRGRGRGRGRGKGREGGGRGRGRGREGERGAHMQRGRSSNCPASGPGAGVPIRIPHSVVAAAHPEACPATCTGTHGHTS